MHSTHRRLIFGIITVLVTVSVSVVLLEILFRLVYFQPRGRVAVPYEFQLSALDGVPYELTPNHRYEWKYGPRSVFDRGFSIPVRTNAMGFRDDPVIMPKPEGTVRILAVGDSFTWGLGVAEEDGWVEQLESLLAQRMHRPVEVINTGVGSWNTEVEAAFLAGKGMSLAPDAVILGFLVNDFRAADTGYAIDDRGYLVTRFKDGSQPAGAERLHLQSLLYEEKPRGNMFRRLVDSSHLIRWISGRRLKTEKRTLMMFNDKTAKQRIWDALDRIHRMTDTAGIPLFVLVFPYVEDPIPTAEKADLDELAAVCHESGLPCLRMEEALAGIPPEELWVHPRDHHPNARAHALYAKLIVSSLFTHPDEIFLKSNPNVLQESIPE